MVPPNSHRVSRARATQDTTIISSYPYGTITSLVNLSRLFRFNPHRISWSYNPKIAVTTLVWANPRSLATTYGITFVFFSSAYLDVSVQRVCSPIGVMHLQCIGLPHSDIYGSIRVANPRSFSQLITSFIASESQGIPIRPYFAYVPPNFI